MRDRKTTHGLRQSFRCAVRGLAIALGERNLRLHLVAAALAVAAGFWFDIGPWQWGLLLVAIVSVLLAEMVNTAIERVVDLASPGYAELARTAKDVAAGAVLLTALAALALGNIIFVAPAAPLLQSATAAIARLPAALPLAAAVVTAATLGSSWIRSPSRQRQLLALAVLMVMVLAGVVAASPSLPWLSLGAVALVALWAAGDCRMGTRHWLALFCWLLFMIWLWQREL